MYLMVELNHAGVHYGFEAQMVVGGFSPLWVHSTVPYG